MKDKNDTNEEEDGDDEVESDYPHIKLEDLLADLHIVDKNEGKEENEEDDGG